METIKRIRSELDHYYEASCKGKIAHTNYQDAKKAKARMERKTELKMKIYKCKFCKLMHIGKVKDYSSEDSRKWSSYVNNR